MRPFLPAAAAVSAILLAGCASSGTPAGRVYTTPPGLADAPAGAIRTPEPPALPVVSRLGETYAWPDGLAITVSRPSRFPIRAAATPEDRPPGEAGVRFTVTIRNGSSAPYVLGYSQVNLTAGPAGEQGGVVCDAGSVCGATVGTVLPGRTRTLTYAWSVLPDLLGMLSVEVDPDFDDRPSVIWEGTAA